MQAFFRNAGGSIVASGEPVVMMTGSSTCRTTASCAGTADEVVSSIGYGPQSSGVGNNLLPVSSSGGSGDGTLTATTGYAYDPIGNVVSVDGPLAGSDDTTILRYDAGRRRLGVISADPDGAGALKRRAQRVTYDAGGRVTATEIGTVNGTSDSDWAGFASLQTGSSTFDSAHRRVTDTITAGGTTYGVAQYSYDALGRLDCSATRMNNAAWGSLPASACTAQAAGSAGPDRISKNAHDAVGRVLKVTSAFGTTDAADDVTRTFTTNGQIATVTDAEGNRTSYVYDGFDRLSQTLYPVASVGAATSSTSDYEQLGYDAGSNVTSRRLRDGQTLYYGYDALNRRTYDDNPNTNVAEVDVSYTYDLLGRMLRAQDQNGWYAAYEYDSLGRATRQYSNVSSNML